MTSYSPTRWTPLAVLAVLAVAGMVALPAQADPGGRRGDRGGRTVAESSAHRGGPAVAPQRVTYTRGDWRHSRDHKVVVQPVVVQPTCRPARPTTRVTTVYTSSPVVYHTRPAVVYRPVVTCSSCGSAHGHGYPCTHRHRYDCGRDRGCGGGCYESGGYITITIGGTIRF